MNDTKRPTVFEWLETRLIALVSRIRSHWIFRIPATVRDVAIFGRANIEQARHWLVMAKELRELKRRLEFHEAGPLELSKRAFDRQRADGMPRPDPRQNGVKSQPKRSIDAHGKLKAVDEPEPPAKP